jgi:ribosomal protein S18 acetylase RimI-like enzyme
MCVIRKATPLDIPRILELYEQLTDEKQHLSAYTTERVFTEIVSMPNQEFLVVEKDSFIVGSLFLLIVPNLTHSARPWAIIENVIVDNEHRRQGIGRYLIEYALTHCKEVGCYKVQLLSNKRRQEAHQFYRSLGFEDSALGFRVYFEELEK